MHEPTPGPIRKGHRTRRAATTLLGLVSVYTATAYLLLPALWARYEKQPGLANQPMVTRTGDGIPGDPLNVGMVGDRDDVAHAMHAAGWYPADPLTLRADAAIVGSVLLGRPDPTAPVSPLYLDGRREDSAYELPSGDSARQRHHVRLWKVLDSGAEGRPVWLGATTFDRSVGVSDYTGQITHDIAPDVDTERDFLVETLSEAKMAAQLYQVAGVGPTINGRNGEGSRYWTDGELRLVVLVEDGAPADEAPEIIPAPPLIAAKDALWRAIGVAIQD